MSLEYQWARFDTLSKADFFRIVTAREAVFVVEQACAYQEIDDMDLKAWHLQVMMDNTFVAYARVVDPGVKYDQPSIGRVMTLAPYRHLKIGRSFMLEAIKFTETAFPNMGIKIGAQMYLNRFYQSLGFENIGTEYDEDGILHIDMIKPPELVKAI